MVASFWISSWIIVGCDVTHPAPGVTNRPSVATLVASMDPFATKYHVYVSVQMPRQEIVTDIAVLLHVRTHVVLSLCEVAYLGQYRERSATTRASGVACQK